MNDHTNNPSATASPAIDQAQEALTAEAARDVDETNQVLADNYLKMTAASPAEPSKDEIPEFCTDGYQQAIRDAVACIERAFSDGEQMVATGSGQSAKAVAVQVSLKKFLAARVGDLAKPTLHGLTDWPTVYCDVCSTRVKVGDKCPSGMCVLPTKAHPGPAVGADLAIYQSIATNYHATPNTPAPVAGTREATARESDQQANQEAQ